MCDHDDDANDDCDSTVAAAHSTAADAGRSLRRASQSPSPSDALEGEFARELMRRSAAASAGRPPPAAEQLSLRPSPLMPPTGVVARLLAVMQSPDWPTESAGCRAAFELSVPRDVRSSPASVVSADWCRGVRATPDTHLVGAGRRGSWQLSACAAGV